MLSQRAQVARLRRLAVAALGAYALDAPTLRFVAHGENTTFAVDAGGTRYLLRVHRPARHGRSVDPAAAVASELEWLAAIRSAAAVSVPEPVRTASGALTTTASHSTVDGPRVCSVLRWVDGRRHTNSPRPAHLHQLGAAMARLHTQADGWQPPAGFVRISWDWETFFGDVMVYGGLPAGAVWDLLPPDLRRRFDRVAALARPVLASAETGLVHADLHLDNALFTRRGIHLIDFDDSGTGARVYDAAVALWELRHRADYPAYRTAFVTGYGEHRRLPDAEHLDLFIAVREVAFALWYAGTAQVNPVFRDRLDRTLAATARSLDTLLS